LKLFTVINFSWAEKLVNWDKNFKQSMYELHTIGGFDFSDFEAMLAVDLP